LLRVPANTLKVDRSFIAAMSKGERNLQIVSTIVALGNGLGMDVVAEGVETAEQRDQLVSFGCRLAQGYFFSRPIDAERMTELLSRQATI
jgi:EAL domain-containing protein (putative c-di-GMP-specific phosphodiesterase class I)